MLAIGMMAMVVGCGQPSDSAGSDQPGKPRDLETVREVKKRHGDEILRRYNAVGHGIGAAGKRDHPPAPEDAVYVIVVSLRSASDKPKSPQQIGGVPLRFLVTGEFEAQ
ncbi:MAG: hypothetical protein ACR2LK_06780 [Solirubrobacteraceae bacterium]